MAHTGKLSAVEVAKAKGPAVLHDGGGLYLRVSATGAKSWVFRFQLDGKRRDMGLGPFPDISLAEARAKAAEHRKQRHEGIDPLDAKAAQRQAQRVSVAKGRTFRECADEFIEKNRAGWRNAKHRQQWGNTLATYVYPTLGELPVSAIDAGLVVQVLDPIWTEKPETASRVRGRIEAVLDAATVRGFRQGPNPAQWKGNLAHILPARAKVRKVAHHAALPFDDMPGFLAALRGREGMSARALEFTILTAARTGEALGARWGEIDLAAKVWTVPAERMKAGREHRVPLSDAALAVLDKVRPLALMTRRQAGPGRAGVSRPAAGTADVQHGDADAAAPHEARRSDRARLPLDVLGLGGRAHRVPARSRRNGARARDREQGRGGLPARRSVRQAAPADGGLGAISARRRSRRGGADGGRAVTSDRGG